MKGVKLIIFNCTHFVLGQKVQTVFVRLYKTNRIKINVSVLMNNNHHGIFLLHVLCYQECCQAQVLGPSALLNPSLKWGYNLQTASPGRVLCDRNAIIKLDFQFESSFKDIFMVKVQSNFNSRFPGRVLCDSVETNIRIFEYFLPNIDIRIQFVDIFRIRILFEYSNILVWIFRNYLMEKYLNFLEIKTQFGEYSVSKE